MVTDQPPTLAAVAKWVKDDVSSATLEMVPVPGMSEAFVIWPCRGMAEVRLPDELFPLAGTEGTYVEAIAEELRALGPVSTVRFAQDELGYLATVVFNMDMVVADPGKYELFRLEHEPLPA